MHFPKFHNHIRSSYLIQKKISTKNVFYGAVNVVTGHPSPIGLNWHGTRKLKGAPALCAAWCCYSFFLIKKYENCKSLLNNYLELGCNILVNALCFPQYCLEPISSVGKDAFRGDLLLNVLKLFQWATGYILYRNCKSRRGNKFKN